MEKGMGVVEFPNSLFYKFPKQGSGYPPPPSVCQSQRQTGLTDAHVDKVIQPEYDDGRSIPMPPSSSLSSSWERSLWWVGGWCKTERKQMRGALDGGPNVAC